MDKSETTSNMKVFVYGTLLYGQRNHSHFLHNANFCTKAIINNYAIYDLGSYPGVKPYAGQKIKGEIYDIDGEILANLDMLEGEGYLYKRIKLDINTSEGLYKDVYIYIYNHEVDENALMPYDQQPWGNRKYVWYACYGSNLLRERFMHYIQGGICRFNNKDYIACRDLSEPLDSRPYDLPYELYFGNSSASWGNNGVAFLDLQKPAKTKGRIYLITEEQFDHLWEQECDSPVWYNQKVSLGERDGIEIVTITNSGHRPENKPSEAYLAVMATGLKEFK